MAGWTAKLRDMIRRGSTPCSGTVRAQRTGVFKTVSRPEHEYDSRDLFNSFLPLPNNTPFEMFRVYRFLRDVIPDVSDAVWTWKRLCWTGYDIEVLEPKDAAGQKRVKQTIEALEHRVNSGDRGIDGLLDIFYTSLFTYGAAALEIVPARSRESIQDVIPVDVWTVRFKREQGRLAAYQVIEGREVRLPDERFIYLGMDMDGTNPYGRSMLRSIPFVIKTQQRLFEDMAKATRNAGWAKLHVRYSPEPRERGESPESYQARIEGNFSELRDRLTGLEADQNLVTYDNVSVELIQGDRHSVAFYETQKAVEEQVITGMHLMPILMGRNYGSTETYGTVQYEIINRQVETVNRGVRQILERLFNREIALSSCAGHVRVQMRQNRTADALKAAHARKIEIHNAVHLRDEGFIDQMKAACLLGFEK